MLYQINQIRIVCPLPKAPAARKFKNNFANVILSVLVTDRLLRFESVLMDSWYATKTVMLHIEQLGKIYYCPLKSNRRVDDSNGVNRTSVLIL